MKTIKLLLALFALITAAFVAQAADKIKVLVVTGGHGFEEQQFFQVFKDNPEITFTAAAHEKNTATAYERDDFLQHDVIVLYDMQQKITDEQKKKFLALFDKGIGVVVTHHALNSFPGWSEYERIIGGHYAEPDPNRTGIVTEKAGYEHDVEIPVVVVAKNHPITAGVKDFTIHDEIYWGFRVAPDVTTLITTTHPKSGKPLAWCRDEKKSRVVYLQLGHDHWAFENPNYRKLLAQSIRWTAKK